jgi:hypothetical protein
MIPLVAGTTIICGLERLSLRIALALALIQLDEHMIIVAESPNPDRLREVKAAGAMCVKGLGRTLPTWRPPSWAAPAAWSSPRERRPRQPAHRAGGS